MIIFVGRLRAPQSPVVGRWKDRLFEQFRNTVLDVSAHGFIRGNRIGSRDDL
jgi:hypothetical protein